MGGPCHGARQAEKWADKGEVGVSYPPALQHVVSDGHFPVLRVVHTVVLCLGELFLGFLLGPLIACHLWVTCSAAVHPSAVLSSPAWALKWM